VCQVDGSAIGSGLLTKVLISAEEKEKIFPPHKKLINFISQ
jgi:hypothetical protein